MGVDGEIWTQERMKFQVPRTEPASEPSTMYLSANQTSLLNPCFSDNLLGACRGTAADTKLVKPNSARALGHSANAVFPCIQARETLNPPCSTTGKQQPRIRDSSFTYRFLSVVVHHNALDLEDVVVLRGSI